MGPRVHNLLRNVCETLGYRSGCEEFVNIRQARLLRLPFDEPYCIPQHTASAIDHVKSKGGRLVAVGTTVVRALESAANADGGVGAGNGVASGRIGRQTPIHVADTILTGVHQPGESHFELLEAFASDAVLAKISEAFSKHSYRSHEFGDSLLIERGRGMPRHSQTPNRPSAGEWMSPSGEA